MYFSFLSFESLIIWLLRLEAHSDLGSVSLQKHFLGSGEFLRQEALRVSLFLIYHDSRCWYCTPRSFKARGLTQWWSSDSITPQMALKQRGWLPLTIWLLSDTAFTEKSNACSFLFVYQLSQYWVDLKYICCALIHCSFYSYWCWNDPIFWPVGGSSHRKLLSPLRMTQAISESSLNLYHENIFLAHLLYFPEPTTSLRTAGSF